MANERLGITIDIDVEGKRELDDLNDNLDDLGKTADNASRGGLDSLVGKAAAVTGGLYALKEGAQVAYAAISEGADLLAAKAKFDNLAVSIDTTSDSLLNGLRSATGGMISDAELVASATDLINLGLAKSEDQAIRLGGAVGALGLDMQVLGLTLANDSTARLDSLGLSMEWVKEKQEELAAQGFEGDTFDEAVIQGLEEKMTLFGDATETTAGQLAILESTYKNIQDAFKEGLAEGTAEQVRDVGENAEIMSLGLAEAARYAGEELPSALERAIKLMPGGNQLIQGFQMMGVRAKEAAEGQEVLTKQAEAADEIFSRYAPTVEDVTESQVDVAEVTRLANEQILEQGGTIGMTSQEMEELAYMTGELGDSEAILQEHIDATNEAAKEQEAAFARLSSASGDMFTDLASADELNFSLSESMYAAADAAGADAASLAILQIATGDLSEAQAEALLKQVAIEQSLQSLGEEYADGEITLQEYFNSANSAIEDIQNMSLEFDRSTGAITETSGAVDDLNIALGIVPADTNTNVNVSGIDEALAKVGDLQIRLSGLSGSGAQPRIATGNDGIENFDSGGAITGGVPASFPNSSDNVVIGAQTGEYMINKSSAAAVGFSNLDFINQYGRLPFGGNYADGGTVGGGAVSGGGYSQVINYYGTESVATVTQEATQGGLDTIRAAGVQI
jgi:hypothetical protein